MNNQPTEVSDSIYRKLTKGKILFDNKKIIVIQGNTTTTYNSCYYTIGYDINGNEIVELRSLDSRNEALHTNSVSMYC